MRDNILHFSHPHNLQPENDNKLYKCDGCKERGWGPRYSCQQCNFDLHKECALADDSISHIFYIRCTFKLFERGLDNAYCIACGKVVPGLGYHCSKNDYFLHPCCLYLPRNIQGEGLELYLHDHLSSKCGLCGRKDKGWSYRNLKKTRHFHVSCIKDEFVQKLEKLYFAEIGKNNPVREITLAPRIQNTRYKASSSSLSGKIKKYCAVLLPFMISAPMGGLPSSVGTLISQEQLAGIFK